MRERVAGAQAKVAVDREGGLAAEGDGALAAALAEDDDDLVVEVEVVGEHDAGGLGDANTGVDEQSDDRGVAAVGEVATDAPLQERLEASVPVQGGGGLPALELVGDEVADVGPLDRVHS